MSATDAQETAPSMPQFLTPEQIAASCPNGPDMRGAAFALINGRVYRHEGATWRLLDNKTYATFEEFVAREHVG